MSNTTDADQHASSHKKCRVGEAHGSATTNRADSVKPPETSCVDTFADNTAISVPVKTFYRPIGCKHKPTQPY